MDSAPGEVGLTPHGDASLRVSDDDREQAVIALREHLLAGRLTLDEFTERVAGALAAKVGADLAGVRQGLPTLATTVTSRRRPARFAAALLSHVVRRGRLRLRGWLFAASVLGDLDLDLREASTDKPRTAVTVLALFGNADIYVPEGVDADVRGLSIFGHLTDRGRDVARPDAPVVHVRVLGLFGTADVWRVPHDLRGSSYHEIIEAVRAARPELPSG